MNVLSLFDGISIGQLALRQTGIKYNNYYTSEIEPKAIKVAQHHFPNTIQLGDVCKIDPKDLPKIDLLLAGSPCQGFSHGGKRLGFNDPRSKLYFEFKRIFNEVKPTWFLLENVCMKQQDQDIISKDLGVKPILINSNLVSAQNRKRLYWTNIPGIAQPVDKNIKLTSILGVDYCIWMLPRPKNKGGLRGLKNNKSPTITSGASWQHNFKLYNTITQTIVGQITPEQCEQLQTIPVGYTNLVANTSRYKLIGNAWTVDIITHILKSLKGLL